MPTPNAVHGCSYRDLDFTALQGLAPYHLPPILDKLLLGMSRCGELHRLVALLERSGCHRPRQTDYLPRAPESNPFGAISFS